MDLFYADKNFNDLSETQFDDFLGNDIFTPPPSTGSPVMDLNLDNGMDQDWLDTFFDDPVLNDRMISDALQPHPQVQSEHSYSLANNEQALDMSIKKEEEKDMDTELLGTTVNPNSMTPTSQIIVTTQTTPAQTSLLTTTTTTTTNQQQTTATSKQEIKQEPVDPETTMVTVTRTTNPHTLLKPTIILATQSTMQQHQQQQSLVNIKPERFVLPKNNVTVKVEPAYTITSSSSSAPSPEISYEALSLPPTPPSSNTSDSEGCQSPERSLPSSPARQPLYAPRASYRATPSPPPYHSQSQPFFMHPVGIPSSGVLMLSEEEKRTLITEGYPIPAKLPLTKTEEKNLKKIRRKIKNKISAQESRRKKKEYLESLERKVESFCQENVDLKKKVDNLENTNRSLMSQLHKLQTLVGKVRPQNASVTGSCLMVLVLCFAVFLGSWSPSTWSVGYSGYSPVGSAVASVGAPGYLGVVDTVLAPGVPVGNGVEAGKGQESNAAPPLLGTAGPDFESPSSDPYSTPNKKSRVLLSLEEEESDVYGPSTPFCLHDMLTRWLSVASKLGGVPKASNAGPGDSDSLLLEPLLPKIDTLDVETEGNQTGGEEGQGHSFKVAVQQAAAAVVENEQAIMHPDIAVMTPSRKQVNATE